MAQFDITTAGFNLPQSAEDPAELKLTIDNPQHMVLDGSPQQNEVPDDVEIVAPGESPTQSLWVYEGHYYLTLVLCAGEGPEELEINNTGYMNEGEDESKYLDIIVRQKLEDGSIESVRTRTRTVVINS